MNFIQFAASEAFFNCSEPLSSPEICNFQSFKGRGRAVMEFLEKLAIVPLAFIVKLIRTSFSILGLAFTLIALIATLCSVSSVRAYFVYRISSLAVDLADWLFWPIGVVFCLVRLVLASTVHPAFYFQS